MATLRSTFISYSTKTCLDTMEFFHRCNVRNVKFQSLDLVHAAGEAQVMYDRSTFTRYTQIPILHSLGVATHLHNTILCSSPINRSIHNTTHLFTQVLIIKPSLPKALLPSPYGTQNQSKSSWVIILHCMLSDGSITAVSQMARSRCRIQTDVKNQARREADWWQIISLQKIRNPAP